MRPLKPDTLRVVHGGVLMNANETDFISFNALSPLTTIAADVFVRAIFRFVRFLIDISLVVSGDLSYDLEHCFYIFAC
ncbi:hypothetical protein Gogos_018516 [Gossypium gossypioides]|uniref:Uncharacterized protein n=1 Tax=Gossypium gossypioides TaxID=34282 RepID=A0A7J9BEA6_GOSGO|nr:hypothetical protein [Gossypium gossypioides]